MAEPKDVLAQLDGDEFTMYGAMPNEYVTTTMRQMLKSVAAEVTYGKVRKGLRSLAKARGQRQTARDDAEAAAVYAEANHAIIVALALNMGINVPRVLAPYIEDRTPE